MQDMELRNHGKTFDKGFKSFRNAEKFSATPEIYFRRQKKRTHTHIHKETHEANSMQYKRVYPARNFMNQHAEQRFY